MSNIEIINNVQRDFNVTVNNVDGKIQIVIDEKRNIVNLLSLRPGDTFKSSDNTEYIVLEQFTNNQTAVIRKELLEGSMEFGSDNNWKTSSIRKFLNGEYLKKIEETFGNGRIVDHMVDLLSLDGLDDYETSLDKVSMLTIDQYRKYRKALGKNIGNWWWLITPNSTSSGNAVRYVQCVRSNGDVFCNGCDYARGVRPFFILQS